MISLRASPAELKRCREALIVRAALERAALREATQDMQIAGDRIARFAMIGASLLRRYWPLLGVLAVSGLFKRARPLLRLARTGLAIWQTVRLLRATRP